MNTIHKAQERVHQFKDTDYILLNYREQGTSFYVAFKRQLEDGDRLFPGQTLDEIIEHHIRPELSATLKKKLMGTFSTVKEFSLWDPHVLIDHENKSIVRNL